MSNNKPLITPKMLLVSILLGIIIWIGFDHFRVPYSGVKIPDLEQKYPQPFPNLKFLSENGNVLSLDRHQGKITLVHFWATWCTPCLKELPALDQLYGKVRSKNVEIIAISTDKLNDSDRNITMYLRAFYKKLGVEHLQVNYDKYRLKYDTVGQIIPYTVILNKDGQEVGRVQGATDWSNPKWLDYFNFHQVGDYSKKK